jgi:hypothetical protein
MDCVNRGKGAIPVFLLAAMLVSVSAFAQVDFSGEWTPIRGEDHTPNPNVLPGDYVGLPISEGARQRADTWSASNWTLPEWQCRPHPVGYITRGPSQLRIDKEIDPVTRQITAFHLEWLRSVRNTIYMDGRPHPSEYAPHTWGGFSTGEWVGNMLKVTTTHVKDGYIRRSGVHRSDKATLTQYLMRRGDIITWIVITDDPVYLTEPLVRSSEYRLVPNQQIPPYPCTVVTEVDRPKGVIPHYLPGSNTELHSYADWYKLPYEVTKGGAATMYPEYQPILKQMLQAEGLSKRD